jgi:hypothetical protein
MNLQIMFPKYNLVLLLTSCIFYTTNLVFVAKMSGSATSSPLPLLASTGFEFALILEHISCSTRADFVLSHFYSTASASTQILMVTNTESHFTSILSKYKRKHSYMFDECLHTLYTKIKQWVQEETQKSSQLLMLLDTSSFFWGDSNEHGFTSQLLCLCRSYGVGLVLCVATTSTSAKHLESAASSVIEVCGLSSGYSRSAHGEVRVSYHKTSTSTSSLYVRGDAGIQFIV